MYQEGVDYGKLIPPGNWYEKIIGLIVAGGIVIGVSSCYNDRLVNKVPMRADSLEQKVIQK